ncbi:MAG: NHL repeat domain protein, partial [Candidatus Peregrinibacteria bacterium GW2011_GWA2_54_9]
IYFKGTANNASYKLGLNAPNGVAVDATNHRLFVSDTTNNRILVYNLTTNNTLSDHLPDYVLGQTNYYWNAVSTTQNGLSAPTGLAFDASNNKLYAADLTNNRILIYDTANISDGENAVGVLGQPSFIVATAGVTQDGLSAPRQIHYDAASEQLYVADSTNNRVVIYGSPSSEQPAESTPVNSFYFYGF